MDFQNYLIQVNLYLILFYAFYALLLRNETFFTLNRIFLNFSAAVSLLIPFTDIAWLKSLFVTGQLEQTRQMILVIGEPVIVGTLNESRFTWGQVFTIVYFSGFVFFLVRFLVALMKVGSQPAQDRQAYSFFKHVFVSESLPGRNMILKHEQLHARHFHSLDVIFFELLAVLLWFNPVVYRYKRSVRSIHEFIADAAAVKGHSQAEYAMLLLHQALGVPVHQLTNNFFNKSLLKKRIIMLSKNRSKKTAVLKYGIFAPLFVAMLVFSSSLAAVRKSKIAMSQETLKVLRKEVLPSSQIYAAKPLEVTNERETPSLKDAPDTSVLNEERPGFVIPETALADTSVLVSFLELERKPEYPGGMMEFYKYVGRNYRYPKTAKEKGVSGTVVIQFVVEGDGSLTGFKVLRDLGLGTGEEAVRVLKSSPKWNPGMQKGRAVRTSYTIPIRLNLSAKSNTDSTKVVQPQIDMTKAFILVDGKQVSAEYMKLIDPGSIDSLNIIKDKNKFEELGAPQDASGVILLKMKKK